LSATEISFAFPEIRKKKFEINTRENRGEYKEKCRPFSGNYETK